MRLPPSSTIPPCGDTNECSGSLRRRPPAVRIDSWPSLSVAADSSFRRKRRSERIARSLCLCAGRKFRANADELPVISRRLAADDLSFFLLALVTSARHRIGSCPVHQHLWFVAAFTGRTEMQAAFFLLLAGRVRNLAARKAVTVVLLPLPASLIRTGFDFFQCD